MSCEYFRELMHGYLDGEISDAELSNLNKRIEECKECKDHFERLKDQAEKLRSLMPACGRADMLSVMRAAKAKKTAKRRKIISVCASAAAVLFITLVSASLVLGVQGSEQDNASAATGSDMAEGSVREESFIVQKSVNEPMLAETADDIAPAEAPAAEASYAPSVSYEDEVYPAIMHNGIIYFFTGKQLETDLSEEEILGEVISVVSSDKYPSEEGQANFDILGSVYTKIIIADNRSQEDLAVLIDNEWILFEPLN